jgi:hypothetical protein
VQCVDGLEMITNYLEGVLPAAQAKFIDEHLSVCDGCRTVLDQWQAVINLAGRVTTDELDALEPSTRARLLASFRNEHPTELTITFPPTTSPHARSGSATSVNSPP